VLGYFEAWQFGPVHPTAYRAFKTAGNQPITFRARRVDPLTGTQSSIPAPKEEQITEIVDRVLGSYGKMTPGRLVEISHAPGAPWHSVVDRARSGTAFGMRITDDLILSRFKYHKVSVGLAPASGEPGEDAPFT
jgi:uncharacterized phage-associated protein